MHIVNLYFRNGSLAFTGTMARTLIRLRTVNRLDISASEILKAARQGTTIARYRVKIVGEIA